MQEQPQEEKKETQIVSRPNHMKFVKFTAEQYAGLNFENTQDKCLVLMFPENERILEAKGNQGTGKTSLLNAFKASMGLPEPENAVNNGTKNKAATLEFIHDDKEYKVRITKSGFNVTYDTELNGKKMTNVVKKPKDVLQNLIGPIGVSPSFLRDKKSGADQIEWIKSLTLKSDSEKEETEIKGKHAADYAERTTINKDVSRLKVDVVATGLYVWDTENFVFLERDEKRLAEEAVKNAPAQEDIQVTYNEASKKRDQLVAGKARLAEIEKDLVKLKEESDDIDRQIEQFMAKKAGKEFTIKETQKSIETATAFLNERANAEEEFTKALNDLQNSSNIAIAKKNLEDVAKKIADYNVVEKRQEELNNNLQEYATQLKELATKYTPAIEGLEIVINGIDDTRSEGVYLNGVNMAHLSESECWDLCLQLWELQGTSVVFIENITSLGSAAIERVNWFAQKGGYVFVSQMQRDYQELKVEFINKIS